MKIAISFQAPEPTIPASVGCHRREWFEACKGRGEAFCNFNYGGPLTETVLLGSVAYRVGEKLEWDAANLKFPNCPRADQYVKRDYRQGWTL